MQSRATIDKDHIADLVETLKDRKKLPPIEVYKDPCDKTLWLADGFHRVLAHQEAGKRSIKAEIHKGCKADAMWHSAGSNLTHGLRRNNADKHKAVEMALKVRPTSSDQLIADHCGVSNTFVSQIRKQIQPANLAGSPRTGSDGKVRKIPPPPPPPKQPKNAKTSTKAHIQPSTVEGCDPKKAHIQPSTVEGCDPKKAHIQPSTVEGCDPKKVKPPPPPGKPAAPKDELGHPIPDHVQVLFDRVGEVQELLTALSNVRGVIRAAADDPLYSEVNAQSVATGIAQAYDAIKATTPYCVCPWCHGQAPMQKGCNGCAGRGVIGKYRYDNAVPRELKK